MSEKGLAALRERQMNLGCTKAFSIEMYLLKVTADGHKYLLNFEMNTVVTYILKTELVH